MSVGLDLSVVSNTAPGAPAVVAVVLLDNPGQRFDDVLRALGAQDYPNVRCLIMDLSGQADVSERVHALLPDAVVRRASDPSAGRGAAANEVRTLVAGSGFLWFLRDDVIPDGDAARLLLEEAYRSNVGIAGAKLVDADEPRRLVSVGFGIDKFGETWQPLQAGELDQEQHDAVLDRFYLSSDCLLIRSDLFDTLGGFDETLSTEVMDLDLCWRAHLSGARVLVAPAARARRVARPTTVLERAQNDRVAAAERLRTIVSSYGAGHLLRVLPQALLVTLIMAVANLVVGQWRRSVAVLAAWPTMLGHLGQSLHKRKQVAALRNVSDTDLRRLQQRGSARLRALLRGSASGEHRLADSIADSGRTFLADVRGNRRWPALFTGLGLIVVFLFSSRSILFGRVSNFGHFVDFPVSARTLVRDYLSDWRPQGFGLVGPAPTGLGLAGLIGVVSFGHMGLARTLATLVPLLLGPIGVWRLLRYATSLRGRVVGSLAYALVPLAVNAVSTGRFAGVIAYGAFPFVLHWLLRAAGEEPFVHPESDVVGPLALGMRMAIVMAIVVAFVPMALVSHAVVVVVLALCFARDFLRARRIVAVGLVGLIGAIVLQLPWALTRTGLWASFHSLDEPTRASARFINLLRFQTGSSTQGRLGWCVLAGPIVAVLVGHSWRFAAAARLSIVAIATFATAWLVGSRGVLGHTSELEALLTPALVCVAVGCGLAVSAVEADLSGHRLSWRQPAAFLAGVLVLLGLVPGLSTIANGRWKSPSLDESATLRFAGAVDDKENARVLWVGDPAALPAPGWTLSPGFAYTVTAGLETNLDDLWPSPAGPSERVVADAVDAAAAASTHRLGQLLGPSAIRYIIVRHRRTDGTEAVTPIGLIEVMQRQLDLRQLNLGDDQIEVFENQAWVPSRAQLSPSAASSSKQQGTASLIRADLSGSTPVLDVISAAKAVGPVEAGEVYLASTLSNKWELQVGGSTLSPHPAFGWANAFTLKEGGTATLSFRTGTSRLIWVAAQTILWLVALVLATGRGLRRRAPRALVSGLPLQSAGVAFDLGHSIEEMPAALVEPRAMEYPEEADDVVGTDAEGLGVVDEPVTVPEVPDPTPVDPSAALPSEPVQDPDEIEVLWASDRDIPEGDQA